MEQLVVVKQKDTEHAVNMSSWSEGLYKQTSTNKHNLQWESMETEWVWQSFELKGYGVDVSMFIK